MKIVDYCVCCESKRIDKSFGYFQPFISNKVMDYPVEQIRFETGAPFFPILFTNSMRCQDCGFVFSQARFEDAEMEKIYTGYRGEAYTSLRNTFEPGYSQLNKNIGKHPKEVQSRAEALIQFMQPEVEANQIGSVLDYGGDEGQHIPPCFNHAKRFVYDVSGANAVDGIVKVGKGFRKEVDFLICSNVLEHLPFPAMALDEMSNWMHKDTILFIDVPDEITGLDHQPVTFHEHVNYFDEKSLVALMKHKGFEVMKSETVTMDFGYTMARQVFLLAKSASAFSSRLS